ncbi:hypothetical protein [Companilactobacillus bobalius]|nr:hypothetical protein [Companilactobacillus bobalius]KAE9557635.1 hypothetical protein ATN92_15910 [Companilactobacillus bobalius]KAE9563781.1 hypothetical protein ATN92_03360 [Companilactobacillus bobalius]OVE96612.1 hypothetical protein LKACC16343_02281 [Companilactobacillus bobalius]GEO58411.1 hypothetical protein LBO01_15400 [Companilactobacillus paralimentarius]
MTDFTGNYSDQKITIDLKDLGSINYYFTKPEEYSKESIFLIMQNREIIGLGIGDLDNTEAATSYIEIVVPENFIVTDFFYFLTKHMVQSGYKINAEYKMQISQVSLQLYEKYWQNVLPILSAFGLRTTPVKRVKPRHKFMASLADVPFKIDYKGSKATVYWQKRSQFLVKSGAILVGQAPLTKSGVIGFAGRFGLRLRQEHEKELHDNVLTKDIVLRSVNEVGTFLYFAGTNGWLQLKSPSGQTLHELTVEK